jgi:hypothetical protein
MVDKELTERDRIPEALPEMDRSGDDAPVDAPDDELWPDAKPLAGQEPG